jgi:hypothetical protein
MHNVSATKSWPHILNLSYTKIMRLEYDVAFKVIRG